MNFKSQVVAVSIPQEGWPYRMAIIVFFLDKYVNKNELVEQLLQYPQSIAMRDISLLT
jgi:hypothetical protein